MLSSRVLTLTTLGYPVAVVENATPGPHKLESETEVRLLFVGGVHGDEPEGVELATRLLAWLTNQVTAFQWKVIPCLNPDGFYSHPKRRTNARGVDLNRNFPSSDWSAASRAPRYFPGSAPASEQETQALINLIESWRPHIIVHFHSINEPCIVYSGKHGAPLANLLQKSSGYPAREDIGYPTPGSLGQYGTLELDIPVICIEEKEGIDLSSIWPRFVNAFTELARNPQQFVSRKNQGKN